MMDMMALALYDKIDVEKSRALDNVGDHIIITCNKFLLWKKKRGQVSGHGHLNKLMVSPLLTSGHLTSLLKPEGNVR